MKGKNLFIGKKCIAILISIMLMLGAAITPMAASPVGDLNSDNAVSAPDLVTLRTVILTGNKDIAYDVNGDGVIDILDLVRLKKMIAQAKTEVTVAIDGKIPEGGLTISGGGVSAFVPEGVLLEEGVSSLTLTVIPLTAAGIPVSESESVASYDVHISGISKDNTVPVIIDLGAVMPKFLNMGNYKIYHVENGENVLMTLVDSREELTAHNRFTYEPETGKVTVAMATFSVVAMVANIENAWNGDYDYSWYDADKTELTIANADQLAGFSAIVGGMNSQIQDSFSGKTVSLLADINLGGVEDESVEDSIFYPIGYYNTDGTYERTETAITSGFYTFNGTFDGNGHTISNIYQNTWEMKGDNNYYAATLQYYRDGMGLFGKVYGGTVKNLTVDNFTSDGEYTTTGVIAAYADCGATFENIAITNCNPRVYNIGNGGIVGCVGWYAKEVTDKVVSFKNITVDNTNKISALWGSWDVACGGIVGQYYPTSGQSSADYPVNAGISFENCHVAGQIDVYNDVCANYQYYAYRYAGMMIGSIRENETIDGHVYPKMDGITAKNCTVHYDTWNDYFYCELVANSLASYTHDHQFSRLERVAAVDGTTVTTLDGGKFTVPATGRYNYVVVNGEFATENATCYHFVDGAVWNHADAGAETVNDVEVLKENNQHIYLPFAQLFTGYGWGVTSKGLSDYEGIETMDITESEQKDSVEKFASKVDGYLTNGETYLVGDLFKAIDAPVAINGSSVRVAIEKVNKDDTVLGTFTANAEDWTQGTVEFEGTGTVKITIQDYLFCTPTVIYVEIIENPVVFDFEDGTIGSDDALDSVLGSAVQSFGFRTNQLNGWFDESYTTKAKIAIADDGNGGKCLELCSGWDRVMITNFNYELENGATYSLSYRIKFAATPLSTEATSSWYVGKSTGKSVMPITKTSMGSVGSIETLTNYCNGDSLCNIYNGDLEANVWLNQSFTFTVDDQVTEDYKYLAIIAGLQSKNTSIFIDDICITKSVTLSFDTKGGNTIEDTSAGIGTLKTVVPEKEGHTFAGWYDENGNQVSGADGKIVVPSKSTTYYACWIGFYNFEDGAGILDTAVNSNNYDNYEENHTSVTAIQEEDGNKFLRINSHTNSGLSVLVNLPFELENGATYSISYKIRDDGSYRTDGKSRYLISQTGLFVGASTGATPKKVANYGPYRSTKLTGLFEEDTSQTYQALKIDDFIEITQTFTVGESDVTDTFKYLQVGYSAKRFNTTEDQRFEYIDIDDIKIEKVIK